MTTISRQIERMRERYPDFRVTSCGWMAVWTGELRPLHRPYTIEISYARRLEVGGAKLLYAYRPRVRLLSPTLITRHPRTGEWAEHLYWDFAKPENSRLCLYDPDAGDDEWSDFDHYIADRIVPWGSNWLACYEGWLATGKWRGGGRHSPRREQSCQTETTSSDQNQGRRKSAVRAAFHNLGRRIGTSASLPLMVAASGESSQPLCWPGLSSDSWKASLLQPDLTLSPVRPPEASSPLGFLRASPPRSCVTSMSTEEERSSLLAA